MNDSSGNIHDGGIHRYAERGFTLIELMVSVALSLVIILVAVAAFRLASQTMSLISRLSIENGMLRTGYFLASDDIDFWNSHANPNYPYCKGYMSDAVSTRVYNGIVVANGADLGNNKYNNLDDKRLFREVKFKTDNAGVAGSGSVANNFDPNWNLPNDRRSWYRNGIIQNQIPFVYDRSLHNVLALVIDFTWSTTQSYGSAWLLGWEPWHIYGDYSILSHVNAGNAFPSNSSPDITMPVNYGAGTSAGNGDDVTAPTANGLEGRGARPALMWRLFKELGHIGVYTYMPPGTINTIVCPSYNNTVANIGQRAMNYCKGEVPWSLSVPSRALADPTRYWNGTTLHWSKTGADSEGDSPHDRWDLDGENPGNLPGKVSCPPESTFPDNTRGNYVYGEPGVNGMIETTIQNTVAYGNSTYSWHPGYSIFGFYYKQPGINHGNSNPFWISDLEVCNGTSRHREEGVTVGLFYGIQQTPTALNQKVTTGSFDAGPLIDRPTRDPYLALDNQFNNDRRDILDRKSIFWQQARDYSSTTVHFPRNITDDTAPNLTDKPTDVPTLSTSIFRYRLKGGDKAMCRVRVQDPTTGRVIDLGFTMLGTTLRGARQHWGWKSHFDVPSMKDMGDFYAP